MDGQKVYFLLEYASICRRLCREKNAYIVFGYPMCIIITNKQPKCIPELEELLSQKVITPGDSLEALHVL